MFPATWSLSAAITFLHQKQAVSAEGSAASSAPPPLLLDFYFQQIQECFTVGFVYKDFVSGVSTCRDMIKRTFKF